MATYLSGNTKYQVDFKPYSVGGTDAGGAASETGFGGINGSKLGQNLTDATKALNDKLANLDVSDPGQLIAMQQQMAIYTVGLQTISAVSKSLEDTLKAIVRNMG